MSADTLFAATAEEEAWARAYWDRIVPVNGEADYRRDFTAWAFDQARRLRALQSNDIDIENVAEEIESLGKGEVDKLESFLTIVVLHLLKWDVQPAFRSRSWRDSVAEHRRRAKKHFADNPSLKAVLDDVVVNAFDRARHDAIIETGMSGKHFPAANPYTLDIIMNRELRLDDPE